MEELLRALLVEVKELNRRIGVNGFNAFIGAETSLISSMEEVSIKLKRLNQSITNNPITLEKHKSINKIQIMAIKKVFTSKVHAQKHSEITGMYIEEIDGKYIVYTKQPSVDTTAEITVVYEDVEKDSAPKKDKKTTKN